MSEEAEEAAHAQIPKSTQRRRAAVHFNQAGVLKGINSGRIGFDTEVSMGAAGLNEFK